MSASDNSSSPAIVTETINTNTQSLLTINMTNVSKFTTTNYLMWNLQVLVLLNGYALAGYLDGSFPITPTTLMTDNQITVNPAYTLWNRQDKLLYSALLGERSQSLQPLVLHCTTSANVWTTLASTYAKPSRGHIKQLKTQLKNWKKETKTIDVYFQDITIRLDQLAILVKAVDHEDQIDLILEGLPEDYKIIIDLTEGRDVPPSITELHERLLNH